MPKFDGDPEEAEADLSRASKALQDAESEYAIAYERLDALDDEVGIADSADLEERMNAADREATRLRELVTEAEEEFDRTVQYWTDEGYITD